MSYEQNAQHGIKQVRRYYKGEDVIAFGCLQIAIYGCGLDGDPVVVRELGALRRLVSRGDKSREVAALIEQLQRRLPETSAMDVLLPWYAKLLNDARKVTERFAAGKLSVRDGRTPENQALIEIRRSGAMPPSSDDREQDASRDIEHVIRNNKETATEVVLRILIRTYTQTAPVVFAWASKTDVQSIPQGTSYVELLAKATSWWDAQEVGASPVPEEVLYQFADGHRVVNVPREGLVREGRLMHHCVGDGAYDRGVGTEFEIHSLRTPDDLPLVTWQRALRGVHEDDQQFVPAEYVMQLFGPWDKPPPADTWPYLEEYFKSLPNKYQKVTATGLLWVPNPELDLRGVDFSDVDFSDVHEVDLHARDLRGCNFARANLNGVRFYGSRLDGCDFTSADVEGADFENASLREAVLHRVTGDNADFTGANLTRANLSRARFDNAKFEGATLKLIDGQQLLLGNSECDRADFTSASLKDARLNGNTFESALFVNADMLGVRLDSYCVNANFTGANLTFANLDGANLDGAHIDAGNTSIPQGFTIYVDDGEAFLMSDEEADDKAIELQDQTFMHAVSEARYEGFDLVEALDKIGVSENEFALAMLENDETWQQTFLELAHETWRSFQRRQEREDSYGDDEDDEEEDDDGEDE